MATPVKLEWTAQPAEPGAWRADTTWTGNTGSGAELVGALKQWPMIRFEVTEEPSPGVDGERFMYVPGRGVFRATTSANGDIQISEDRLRAMMIAARGRGIEQLTHALDKALGTAWDVELEPFRHAADGQPVPLLTRVG